MLLWNYISLFGWNTIRADIYIFWGNIFLDVRVQLLSEYNYFYSFEKKFIKKIIKNNILPG